MGRMLKTMDWVPILLLSFKFIVLGVGMFFAVKWHYDKDKESGKGEVLRSVGKVAVVFLVSLTILMFVTFKFVTMLGLNLGHM